jgi:hypothetical protein
LFGGKPAKKALPAKPDKNKQAEEPKSADDDKRPSPAHTGR